MERGDLSREGNSMSSGTFSATIPPSTMPPVDLSIDGSFDLDAYASNYSARAKIRRLLFISQRCPQLEKDALAAAIQEIIKGRNTNLYREVVRAYAQLVPGFEGDTAWLQQTDAKNARDSDRHQSELNSSRTMLIKESVRLSQVELGDLDYERGDLQSALRWYMKTKDYCTTSKHILSNHMMVIQVSLDLGHMTNVTTYVNRAEQTGDQLDNVTASRLKCAAGIAHLENRRFKLAALSFLGTHYEMGNTFNQILSSLDVAIYGGLCALATFDRSEIQTKIMENSEFKQYLELVPEIRDAIYDFHATRYTSCLRILNRMKNELLLDIYLFNHVSSLYQMIRNKALVQYFSPFSTVDLHRMAEVFLTTVPELEKELMTLITNNSIQGRIDAHKKVSLLNFHSFFPFAFFLSL
eukprot:TRINITY_DN3410_c0_g3_i10.p1 TRINITY_DN3410_c0_g3~~TRINITY_DN3410_c0_g3_i10.p1  ORF type:complete len:410 (+),score=83.93 TRINITY_DN3410_c0_g3_i10:46-1275(+)